jgi:catechol 2,3-dioxygenase-like lactoylglutathione lyase family enzyme
VRQVTWGVECADDLAAIAAELGTDRAVTERPDGTICTTDPVGYPIAFRLSTTTGIAAAAPDYNVPGLAQRIDARGKVYKDARPQYLSHVVFKVPDLEAAVPFYTDRLGFKVTDSYPGQGYFLRAGASSDHHNLFLLKVGDEVGFHHAAFELGSIHELFGGGLNMGARGWDTHLGPGRHPISSCYFWYFKNPCGGAAEYDWDSDHITDSWVAREWERAPDVFAEWALESGMQLYGGVQTGSV